MALLRRKEAKKERFFNVKKAPVSEGRKRNQIDLSYRSKRGAGRPAGREAAGLTFCPVSDLETTRCACKKRVPKNNFKKCRKNDTKWIIIRLNNANKKPFCHSGET